MQDSDLPLRISMPWAASAGGVYIQNPVPIASQIGIVPGRASWTDGFVPLNFVPVSAGGVPPFGKDFNGLLNQTTAGVRWIQAGGPAFYNSTFATAIGGYPKNAVVASIVEVGLFWLTTVDNNTTDPDSSSAANWIALIRRPLGANADYYVATTGSDSNNGSSGAPWLTLQHAWSVIRRNIYASGFAVTLHVANGTYNAGLRISEPTPLGGTLYVTGNIGSPTSCIIDVTNDCCFDISGPNQVVIQGFSTKASGLFATNPNHWSGVGIACGNGAIVVFGNIDFNVCGQAHRVVSAAQMFSVVGTSCTLTGDSPYHFLAGSGATANHDTLTYTTPSGARTFSSNFQLISHAWVGYNNPSMTGAGATGTNIINMQGILIKNGGTAFYGTAPSADAATFGLYQTSYPSPPSPPMP